MGWIFPNDAVTVMWSFCLNATVFREGGKNEEAQSGYFFAVLRRKLPMQRFGGFYIKIVKLCLYRAFFVEGIQ